MALNLIETATLLLILPALAGILAGALLVALDRSPRRASRKGDR